MRDQPPIIQNLTEEPAIGPGGDSQSLTGSKDSQAMAPSKVHFDQIINSGLVYYERLPMLEGVFDRLVRLMSSSLRSLTGENVGIRLEFMKSIRFSEYIKNLRTPCVISIFRAKEWDSHGLLVPDTNLVHILVDSLLGGRKLGNSVPLEVRPYTNIECSLVQRLTEVILYDLKLAFENITPVSFVQERLESNPAFASIVRPANAVIMVHIEVQVEDKRGAIELIIPYATIEPIRHLLLQSFMGENFGDDTIWSDHLKEQVIETTIEVYAHLKEVYISLSDVLGWKVGTQLVLDTQPNDPVLVSCKDYPLFWGMMGQKSGNIAIRLESNLPGEREVYGSDY